MRSAVRPLAFAALLLGFAPAAFAIHDWTGVPSTGAIDAGSLGTFNFAGATLTFAPGTAGTVMARYNVTNTFDNNPNPDMPLWTTLELGYSAPGGTAAATVFEVNPCTGRQVPICTVNSAPGLVNVCGTCAFGAGTFDFAHFLYYIEVTLTRPNPAIPAPSANSLRLF